MTQVVDLVMSLDAVCCQLQRALPHTTVVHEYVERHPAVCVGGFGFRVRGLTCRIRGLAASHCLRGEAEPRAWG